MNIVEAILNRRSIRGFINKPVPKEALHQIIDVALRAPSSMNTQSWEITIVTGDVLAKIKEENVKALSKGDRPDQGGPVRPYEGEYRQRQIEIAVQLYKSMGITREDTKRRAEWWQYGIRYFEAPAAIFLHVDKSFPEMVGQFSLGTIAQTICLAALHHGLGTCIEVQGIMFPDVVRKYTGISENKRLATAIAIGYPDWDFPANNVISTREPIDKVVTWCGFQE